MAVAPIFEVRTSLHVSLVIQGSKERLTKRHTHTLHDYLSMLGPLSSMPPLDPPNPPSTPPLIPAGLRGGGKGNGCGQERGNWVEVMRWVARGEGRGKEGNGGRDDAALIKKEVVMIRRKGGERRTRVESEEK